MKITYLKLKNFIGIYNGLGKKEIELDLTKGSNSIILLVGTNGSGKSTIMSAMHPFHNTFDDRTNIILPGYDGYKEIHIETEKGKYTIQHHYQNKKKTKSVKSFIQLNGNELNENGGVKTFEEIIKAELDLVPSFMTLSNIGSNTQNFIDKKSTDRKKAINEFLPDIEDFLYSYKIINDKWSACRREIKTVTDQLSKLDDINHLESLETSILGQIKNYEDLVQSESKLCTELEYKLKQLDPDGMIRENFKQMAIEYKDVQDELKELYDIDYGKYENLNDVLDALNKVSKKKDKFTFELNSAKERLSNANSNIIRYKKNLTDKEELLSKYILDKDLNEYREIKLEYELEISRLKDELNNYNKLFSQYNSLTLEELNTYDSKLSSIYVSVDALLERLDRETIRNATKDVALNYNEDMKRLRKSRDTLKNQLDITKEKRTELLANIHHAETLEQRPKSCKDDECPFIKTALKYINLDIKLNSIEKELNELINANDKINNELENTILLYDAYKDVSSILNMIINDSVLSKIEHFKDLDYTRCLDKIVLGDRNKYTDITDIRDYVGLNEDVSKYTELLNEVNNNISILEDKQLLIESLQSDIEQLENDIISTESDIDNLTTSIDKYTNNLNKLDELEEILKEAEIHYNELNTKEARFEELTDKLKEIEDSVSEIKSANRSIKESRSRIEPYEDKLVELNKELDKIKISKSKINEYTESKNKLDSKFNSLNIVRDALNPTKGIPLLFINTYLTKTKLIANKLLDVAFKGKFQIEEFEVTEKDFFIKLRKENGELVPDIGYASQGEKALVSVAISMALIQQSMRKYNILLLDEIDAELDVNNRRAFIEILETQFEMLGIEQCFLITHNNEFDTYNTDLVLMKNHNIDTSNKAYMNNKTIIFEA